MPSAHSFNAAFTGKKHCASTLLLALSKEEVMQKIGEREKLLGEKSNGWNDFYVNRLDFLKYSLATSVAVWAGSTIPAGWA